MYEHLWVYLYTILMAAPPSPSSETIPGTSCADQISPEGKWGRERYHKEYPLPPPPPATQLYKPINLHCQLSTISIQYSGFHLRLNFPCCVRNCVLRKTAHTSKLCFKRMFKRPAFLQNGWSYAIPYAAWKIRTQLKSAVQCKCTLSIQTKLALNI